MECIFYQIQIPVGEDLRSWLYDIVVSGKLGMAVISHVIVQLLGGNGADGLVGLMLEVGIYGEANG